MALCQHKPYISPRNRLYKQAHTPYRCALIWRLIPGMEGATVMNPPGGERWQVCWLPPSWQVNGWWRGGWCLVCYRTGEVRALPAGKVPAR